MKSVIIRCDASIDIGSGHVMRCRAIARELKPTDRRIIFLCRKQSGDLISLLKNEFEVLELPDLNKKSEEEIPLKEKYFNWLGCSQEQDAIDCINALNQADITKIDRLIVDHYALDSTWEKKIIQSQFYHNECQLIAIDDLANRSHQANIIVDQNFFGMRTEDRYKGLVPTDCKMLLGPFYSLLGEEYRKLHPIVPSRSEIKRVLVFFGGVDLENCTEIALTALNQAEFKHLAVDVVLGAHAPNYNRVKELVKHRKLTNLYQSINSLAGLISRADIAIGAGGTTTWERSCLKLPSLVVSVAENQLEISRALNNAGKIDLLGSINEVSPKLIQSKLQHWLGKSRNELEVDPLTDGLGSSRLRFAMFGCDGNFSLRPIEIHDEALLLQWSNDPSVRANSISTKTISVEAHREWFYSGLSDTNRQHFIAIDKYGCPFGQIRFDMSPTKDEVLISFSLDRIARGKRLAVPMLREGIELMHCIWGKKFDIIADVLTSNIASQSCFKQLDFKQDILGSEKKKLTRWRLKGNPNSGLGRTTASKT